MTKKIIPFMIVVIIGITVVAGCSNPASPIVPPIIPPVNLSSDKVITSFSFKAEVNTALSRDVTATISGTSITAGIPYGKDLTELVATFTSSPGSRVTIGSTLQTSGSSINNFSNSVTYTVTAEDGSTAQYIITIREEYSGINFQGNGAINSQGNSLYIQSLDNGETATLTACDFTREGYTFVGWSLTEKGAAPYLDGANYTLNGDSVTLYARWLSATATAADDFTFTVTDDEVSISSYDGSDTEVEIPELILDSVSGYYCPVTELADGSINTRFLLLFNLIIPQTGVFLNNTTLTSVSFPETLTSIGMFAFYGCTALETLSLPDYLISIGLSAFEVCESLSSISIPAGVTHIEANPFNYCTHLETIEVDSENSSFMASDGVLFDINQETLISYPAGKEETSYNLPLSVLSIGAYSFTGCNTLTSLTLNSALKSIGAYAFSECQYLAGELVLPASLEAIESGAFNSCYSITSFSVETGSSSFSTVDGILFNYNSSILICYPGGKTDTEYTIPSSVVEIADYCFNSSYLLSSIVLDSTTPPTLGTNVFNTSFVDEIIVPIFAHSTYMNSDGWSDYDDNITGPMTILSSDDPDRYDQFGSSVCISGDGTICAVIDRPITTSTDSSLSFYSLSDGIWNLNQTVNLTNSDITPESLAISNDGHTVMLGFPEEETVYVFTSSNGISWSEEAQLTPETEAEGCLFGNSISLSSDGKTALIGAGGNNETGMAFIFQSGADWSNATECVILDTNSLYCNYPFSNGIKVALSDDGNTAVLVTNESSGFYAYGPHDDFGTIVTSTYVLFGMICIYTVEDGNWEETADETTGLNIDCQIIEGTRSRCVDVSADGSVILVGQNEYATIYELSGSEWVETAELNASENENGDYFGYSVSLNADGTMAVIGAYEDENSDSDHLGSVYLFKTSSSWGDTNETSRMVFPVSSGADPTDFGKTLELSGDGTSLIVGASDAYSEDLTVGYAGLAFILELE